MTVKSADAPPRPVPQGACPHLLSPCYATARECEDCTPYSSIRYTRTGHLPLQNKFLSTTGPCLLLVLLLCRKYL